MTNYFENQPKEIIIEIFNFVPHCWPLLSLTCKHFNEILKYRNNKNSRNFSIKKNNQYDILYDFIQSKNFDICKKIKINVYSSYEIAVQRVHIPVLEYLFNNYDKKYFKFFEKYCNAIHIDNHEILEWMIDKGIPMSHACAAAARAGRFDLLKWLKEINCPLGDNVCVFAAKRGDLEMLKWAIENGCRVDFNTIRAAAGSNQILILKYLYSHGYRIRGDNFDEAAKNGHIEVFKWFKEIDSINSIVSSDLLNTAIKNNQINLIKYMNNNSFSFNSHSFNYAVEFGELDLIKCLYEMGCKHNTLSGCRIEKNHIDIFKLLIEKGYEIHGRDFTNLARKGNLSILKWLCTQSDEMNPASVSVEAIKNGYLEILKWIDDEGYIWNIEQCLELSRRHNYKHIEEWILQLTLE